MHTQKFFSYLQHEKRFSPHTVTAYKSDIGQFLEYINTTYQITRPEEILPTFIRSWLVSMMENETSARSVNRKITTLKTFYKYLQREDLVKENPMLKIQAPKTPKRLPVFVEDDKMNLLLDEVKFEEGFSGQRDKLIIELFYSTGIRLAELINLKETNIDTSHKSIKVLGKRNKERIIPLNHSIFKAIIDFIQQKKALQLNNKSGLLFVTDKGENLYPKFVYRVVNKYLSKVTTLSKKSPHVLRHTFATQLLNRGADINAIKELLGHANLSATQIYTHNTIEKLKQAHKKSHPREKKKQN